MHEAVFLPERAPEDLIELGRITGAHGVRGWIKIQPYSDDAAVLSGSRRWWLKTPEQGSGNGGETIKAVAVQACHPHGGLLLAQLQGLSDRDAAQSLRGGVVCVSRADFPKATEDEYYWVDLIGCDFYGSGPAGPAFFGRVDHIFDNGAHAVLQVRRGTLDPDRRFQAHQRPDGGAIHILVPFVAAHIQHVDLAGRRIDSDWPEDF